MIDDGIDDPEGLAQLVRVTIQALPPPKPKLAKKKAAKKKVARRSRRMQP